MSLQSFFLVIFKEEIKDELFKEQMIFLGLNDNNTIINKGESTPADVMQFVLEKKLVLQPHDKDMVVMLHEIDYLLNNQQYSVKSSPIVKDTMLLKLPWQKLLASHWL